MSTVYEINKGINRPIEFKGFKAQYITYLALGMTLLLLLFAIMYVSGLKIYYCLAIVFPAGAAFVVTIQRLSNTYGEFGLAKKIASSKLPISVRCNSRQLFIQLLHEPHGQK
jgi:hypothetical protein